MQAYEYTITPYYIPEVNELALYTKYYKIGDGVLSYDVVATFTAPDLNTFDTAEAWYREGAGAVSYTHLEKAYRSYSCRRLRYDGGIGCL